jgi:hypothetical protein
LAQAATSRTSAVSDLLRGSAPISGGEGRSDRSSRLFGNEDVDGMIRCVRSTEYLMLLILYARALEPPVS